MDAFKPNVIINYIKINHKKGNTMKNKMIFTMLLMVSLIGTPSIGWALPGFGFTEFYSTADSTLPNPAPQSNFIYGGEQPYVYIKLSLPQNTLASTITGWVAPDGTSYFGSLMAINNNLFRLDTLNNWNDVSQIGTWTTHANYFDSRGNHDSAQLSFTVESDAAASVTTPEPGTILTLLAGLACAPVFGFRRKKESV
jgi:hypothetical protein